jgi:hypothetical protein
MSKSRPPKPQVKPTPYVHPSASSRQPPQQVLVDDYSIKGESNVKTDPSLPDGGPSPGPLPVELSQQQQTQERE